METHRLSCLLLDIGGVVLNNAWDRFARRRAAASFRLDPVELEQRHHLLFESYENGRLSLDQYLGLLVFYRARKFTPQDLKDFIFKQSSQMPGMTELLNREKLRLNFKIIAFNNEGLEINENRIQRFGLNRWIDFFVSSSFVHLRKPSPEFFQLVLRVAQVPKKELLYLDNTELFVDVARELGIPSLLHTELEQTRKYFKVIGIKNAAA